MDFITNTINELDILEDSAPVNENDQGLSLSPAEKVPPEVFSKIFTKITKKSLVDSRLVSSTWRNTVVNDSQLMKSLTFKVTDAQAFLDSGLATKVKCIRFDRPLKNSEECLEKFFKVIGNTVEQVTFIISKHRAQGMSDTKTRLEMMFKMVLRHCTNLNDLTLGSKENGGGGMNGDCNFIGAVWDSDKNIKMVLSKIQHLSVDAIDNCLGDIRQLLLNLPNLSTLAFGEYVADPDPSVGFRVLGIILEHLQKFNGKLQEVSYSTNIAYLGPGSPITKFILSLGKLSPNTIYKDEARLNDFCEAKETPALKVNELTCRAIRKAVVHLFNDALDTSRIAFCTNIHTFEINVNLDEDLVEFLGVPNVRRISSSKLGFISQLKKLTYLKVKDDGKKLGHEREVRLLSSEVFSCGIPSLTTLDFDGEGLGLNPMPFQLCFPNLAKLYIRNYSGELNDDFVYDLTPLEQLRSLTLEKIETLTDRHLTKAYDFMDKDKKITKLPAMAGFTSLRRVHIIGCNSLTDNCLVNGLALCKNLARITLCNVKGKAKFTSRGLNYLQHSRKYKYTVEDVSDSHGKKKHSSTPGNGNKEAEKLMDLCSRIEDAAMQAFVREKVAKLRAGDKEGIVYESKRFIG